MFENGRILHKEQESKNSTREERIVSPYNDLIDFT